MPAQAAEIQGACLAQWSIRGGLGRTERLDVARRPLQRDHRGAALAAGDGAVTQRVLPALLAVRDEIRGHTLRVEAVVDLDQLHEIGECHVARAVGGDGRAERKGLVLPAGDRVACSVRYV